MTENDLKQIEAEFGVVLPHAYRRLLLSPPSMLIALMDAYAQENSEFEIPIFLNASVITAENREARDPEEGFVYNEQSEDDLWPSEYFIIGADCGGNKYCVKPASGKSVVFEWDHSGGDNFEECADSMKRYVEIWFKELGEVAAMDVEDYPD